MGAWTCFRFSPVAVSEFKRREMYLPGHSPTDIWCHRFDRYRLTRSLMRCTESMLREIHPFERRHTAGASCAARRISAERLINFEPATRPLVAIRKLPQKYARYAEPDGRMQGSGLHAGSKLARVLKHGRRGAPAGQHRTHVDRAGCSASAWWTNLRHDRPEMPAASILASTPTELLIVTIRACNITIPLITPPAGFRELSLALGHKHLRFTLWIYQLSSAAPSLPLRPVGSSGLDVGSR